MAMKPFVLMSTSCRHPITHPNLVFRWSIQSGPHCLDRLRCHCNIETPMCQIQPSCINAQRNTTIFPKYNHKLHKQTQCRNLIEISAGSKYLRGLSWQAGNPPDVDRCKLCSTYREAHVLHRIEETALQAGTSFGF